MKRSTQRKFFIGQSGIANMDDKGDQNRNNKQQLYHLRLLPMRAHTLYFFHNNDLAHEGDSRSL